MKNMRGKGITKVLSNLSVKTKGVINKGFKKKTEVLKALDDVHLEHELSLKRSKVFWSHLDGPISVLVDENLKTIEGILTSESEKKVKSRPWLFDQSFVGFLMEALLVLDRNLLSGKVLNFLMTENVICDGWKQTMCAIPGRGVQSQEFANVCFLTEYSMLNSVILKDFNFSGDDVFIYLSTVFDGLEENFKPDAEVCIALNNLFCGLFASGLKEPELSKNLLKKRFVRIISTKFLETYDSDLIKITENKPTKDLDYSDSKFVETFLEKFSISVDFTEAIKPTTAEYLLSLFRVFLHTSDDLHSYLTAWKQRKDINNVFTDLPHLTSLLICINDIQMIAQIADFCGLSLEQKFCAKPNGYSTSYFLGDPEQAAKLNDIDLKTTVKTIMS